MKKAYLIISVIALITCLAAIPHLVEGIAERGLASVNYGPVFFNLLISVIFFWLFRRKKKLEI